MARIFERSFGPKTDLKRNTFDLSYSSHLSTKIGQLTPIMCKEVIPGDSVEIQAAFGLRFAPLVFPVQTKVHAVTHFFYVRNRNLYKDWMEYIGKTSETAIAPYRTISPADAKSQIGTGSLGDYLGVPSTIAGTYANVVTLPLTNKLSRSSREQVDSVKFFSVSNKAVPSQDYVGASVLRWAVASAQIDKNTALWQLAGAKNSDSGRFGTVVRNDIGTYPYSLQTWFYYTFFVYASSMPLRSPFSNGDMCFHGATNAGSGASLDCYISVWRSNGSIENASMWGFVPATFTYTNDMWQTNISKEKAALLNTFVGDFSQNVYVAVLIPTTSKARQYISDYNVSSSDAEFATLGTSLSMPVEYGSVKDATDEDTVANNPFIGDTPKIPLSALPFRAYEAIYNSFYRNEIIDPLVIDGSPVYNQYNRNLEGGADRLNYDLHFRNWEADYFTSCQPSPQMGLAPLVGLTSVSADGTFTFTDVDSGTTFQAKTTIGADGETIEGISTYDKGAPIGTIRNLMDHITNGISINDFRNVNALQRWLETNIRRGYKYVDQMESHFGVTPAYKANDVPEFIGGCHQLVDISSVTNTSDALGEIAGQAQALGGLENTIRKYCDEHGFIVGILCVYPEPVYSQMLPKHFTKTETPLDYFFPEFGHIGMQPITYREVTPLQAAAADVTNGTDTINEVFGYQRAWADYLASNDEVHGDLRTTLSDYVISRTFDEKPELGKRFITIHPDDVNDVFKYTGDDSKIYGQVRVRMMAKRPIPRFGIPRLE